MLPAAPGGEPEEWITAGLGAATRYGNYAMEHLINEIMKNARNGCIRENLEVKIFGGSQVIKSMADIGNRNILFVRDYLKTEHMQATIEDVGDTYPRTVVYFPSTGLVRVKRLQTMRVKYIANQEKEYMDNIADKPVSGDVELF